MMAPPPDSKQASPRAADQNDDTRRKLLRAMALSGAGMALGQIPYQSPAVKSFFGTRTAWAQPTGPMCGTIVATTRPTTDGPTADFDVSNTGTEAFELAAINSSNSNFVVLSPSLPVTINPQSSVAGSVELVCSMSGPQTTTLSFVAQTASGPVSCPSLDITRACALDCTVTPTALTIDDDMCDQAGTTGTFTIENTGDIPFSIDALDIVTTDPSYSDIWQILSPAVPVALQPGETVDVEVNYRCCESEGGSATVQITTSSTAGPASCTQVAVTGNCNLRD